MDEGDERWMDIRRKRRSAQEEAWEAYKKIIVEFGPPDVLLVNGDCIAGNEKKQGGAELITADRQEQAEMAIKCISEWKAKKILMTYGTAYHVGDGAEDFELGIADHFGAEIRGQFNFSVEGCVINAKHHVGSSQIPYSRATAVLREAVLNMLRYASEQESKADIIIRSHVHYYCYVETPYQVAFTTPALQTRGGRLGRICGGETHWGAVKLTIDKGKIREKRVICETLRKDRTQVLKVV